jgi:iron-chelate-transporting ATPase
MRVGLSGEGMVLAYQDVTVVDGVSVELRPGSVTALIGPNGSGKSTVLRSLARLHRMRSGDLRLGAGAGDQDAAALSAREFACRVTLLSQSRPHPSGLEIRDVVAFGRHPHRRRFAAMTDDDRDAIDRALELTGIAAMADRPFDQVSGGELQRVWLATCLAQDTGIVLLDEPTNHLDLRFQVEVLELVRSLADEHGTAIGVVLHDLNHAALVADEVVLLHEGRVLDRGAPERVLAGPHLSEAFGLEIDATVDPVTRRVRIEPRSHGRLRTSRRPDHHQGAP